MVFVDRKHHAHHAASNLLLLLGVVVEMAFHVAETALHTQGRCYEAHARNQLIGGNAIQHFEVLEIRLRRSCRIRRRCGRELNGRTRVLGRLSRQDGPNLFGELIGLHWISLLSVKIDQSACCRRMYGIERNGTFQVNKRAGNVSRLLVRGGNIGLRHRRVRLQRQRAFKGKLGFRSLFSNEQCCSHGSEDFRVRGELLLHFSQQSISANQRIRRSTLQACADVRDTEVTRV
jgi:hypothetical protein